MIEPGGLTLGRVGQAAQFLEPHIRRTPVEPSEALSERAGVPVWLKLENLQVTGSFKFRGALFRLSRLTEEQMRSGIATCSAGNHGKAVAYAARMLGLPATITVPKTVDAAKHRAMIELGAHVIRSRFEGYDDSEEWARQEAARSGLPFISPFDDWDIMVGNGGTLAQEVLQQVPEARTFLLPVGGGGLAAGFALVAQQSLAEARIIGCQLAASPGLKLSLQRGEAVTRLPAAETVAGGIEGGLGRMTFEVLRNRMTVQDVALLSEEEIREAFVWMLDRHQYLIEPSSAVTVAALLTGKARSLQSPAVAILSGRNVALETARRLLA